MIIHGDCLEAMTSLPENSVDAIVTDPPYGLSFMGKKWDYDVPSVEIWKEALRVLRPGGHLLSFGGTRTYHRLVVAMEDAGFEIRDQIQWLYGSGFPKSLDVSKAIDKAAGAEREMYLDPKWAVRYPNGPGGGGSDKVQQRKKHIMANPLMTSDPVTDAAKQWQGWGTGLKPANEPICLARKPLEKGLTVAQNVLKWGTGALNIDGCRIELNGDYKCKANGRPSLTALGDKYNPSLANKADDVGRWPANVVMDEEAAAMLDEQTGTLRARGNKTAKDHGADYEASSYAFGGREVGFAGDSGGASRFYYVAKASKSERNRGLEGMPEKAAPKFDGGDFERGNGNNAKDQKSANFHPTVKPIKLMEHLITLITPPGGTVLDPFMGSGTTGVAAKRLGFQFIGIEREREYVEIASRRLMAVG